MLVSDFKKYLLNELNRSTLTAEAYAADVEQWIDYTTAGKPDTLSIDTISPEDVRLWVASLSQAGMSAR
ncbi:MAG: site-specific integrase [Muribaculaceae bacterium]|nr:site-specific integrase [Muribaculaceae bacterium]